MKTKRTFFAIIIAIAMVLTTLNGCSETGNEEINSFQSDTSEEDSTEVREYGHAMKWVEIPVDDEQDFEDEIMDIIDEFQDMNEHDEEYDLYSRAEIAEISTFYSLDGLEVDGYKLYSAFVSPAVFVFYFAAFEVAERSPDEFWIDDSTFYISIHRPEYYDSSDLFYDILKDSQEQGYGDLTEDGMIYEKTPRLLYAKLNDTIFSIQILDESSELNNYEYMRDIALQIIETATPVDVEQELEQRGKGRNKNQSRRRNQSSD